MKDFELEDCVVSKGSCGIFYIQTKCQTNCFHEETAEKLKDWLDVALRKPRYYITESNDDVRIRDSNIPTNAGLHITMATYYKNGDFDARGEAEKLCQRLNQQEEKEVKL